jgi:hypothetical protein
VPDGPWAGSQRVRVLLVPDLEDPADGWASALPGVAGALAGGSATLALALPADRLERPPAAVAQLAAAGLAIDLLLTEQPRTDAGWEALVSGATVLVLTGQQPELEALARGLGVEVQDARPPRGPSVSSPLPVAPPPAVPLHGRP